MPVVLAPPADIPAGGRPVRHARHVQPPLRDTGGASRSPLSSPPHSRSSTATVCSYSRPARSALPPAHTAPTLPNSDKAPIRWKTTPLSGAVEVQPVHHRDVDQVLRRQAPVALRLQVVGGVVE